MLYNVALVSAVQYHESAICPCIYSLLPTTSPIPPLWVITEHKAELSGLYSRFLLAIYFTYGTVIQDTTQVVLVVKNPPVNARDIRDAASLPGLGRYPGGGNGNPLQYSCLKNSWTEDPRRQESTGLQRVRRN